MFGRKQTTNPQVERQVERLTQEIRVSRSHLQAAVRHDVTRQTRGIGMLFRVYATVHPVPVIVQE